MQIPTPGIKKDGAIAQLVEQRTENPCVPGSIPGGTTEGKDENHSLFLYPRYSIHVQLPTKKADSTRKPAFTQYHLKEFIPL